MSKTRSDIIKRYTPRRAAAGASVCRDAPKASKTNKITPKGSRGAHRVSIPLRLELALQEMYPDVSMPVAIRKFIIDNVEPVSLHELLEEE